MPLFQHGGGAEHKESCHGAHANRHERLTRVLANHRDLRAVPELSDKRGCKCNGEDPLSGHRRWLLVLFQSLSVLILGRMLSSWPAAAVLIGTSLRDLGFGLLELAQAILLREVIVFRVQTSEDKETVAADMSSVRGAMTVEIEIPKAADNATWRTNDKKQPQKTVSDIERYCMATTIAMKNVLSNISAASNQDESLEENAVPLLRGAT
eukprot:CAMPEP_0117561256 /NCGR_PEP_ID=MMETSP0784-20121206/54317_1 /TAXON_ID=39447 /ORGANISM="" /LENGTH=208 /DNA_ID=CAMNT_0005358729 /DNA_START=83 /DNA_END=706 /DNA_ORIENTATION=+